MVYENGELAWKEIENRGQKAIIVITDCLMPKMNGMTLIRMVKQYYHYPKIKIIMMSGGNVEGEALAEGANRFLKKPFTLGQFQKAVQEVLL